MERLKSQKVEPSPEVPGECWWLNFCFSYVVLIVTDSYLTIKIYFLLQLKKMLFPTVMELKASYIINQRPKHKGIRPLLKTHLRITMNSKIKSWPSRGSPRHTRICHQATRKLHRTNITCHNSAPRTWTSTYRLLWHFHCSVQEQSLSSIGLFKPIWHGFGKQELKESSTK